MNSRVATRQLQRISQQTVRQRHAPFRKLPSLAQAQRSLHLRSSPPSVLRKQLPISRIAAQRRHESTESSYHRPLTDRSETSQQDGQNETDNIAARKAEEPAYELTFTCRKCLHRSSHRVTKQAYHFGTTLITCPGCKNRHLISDHLRIFSDNKATIEDILKEKGEFLRKGRLGEDGDIEFYDEKENYQDLVDEVDREQNRRASDG